MRLGQTVNDITTGVFNVSVCSRHKLKKRRIKTYESYGEGLNKWLLGFNSSKCKVIRHLHMMNGNNHQKSRKKNKLGKHQEWLQSKNSTNSIGDTGNFKTAFRNPVNYLRETSPRAHSPGVMSLLHSIVEVRRYKRRQKPPPVSESQHLWHQTRQSSYCIMTITTAWREYPHKH